MTIYEQGFQTLGHDSRQNVCRENRKALGAPGSATDGRNEGEIIGRVERCAEVAGDQGQDVGRVEGRAEIGGTPGGDETRLG